MNFSNFLLTDTAGNKSATLTIFVMGAIIVHIKLLFAGMHMGDIMFPPFSGSEYAAAMGALGGIYVLRRAGNPAPSVGQNNNTQQK